jgi:hypothetical protein
MKVLINDDDGDHDDDDDGDDHDDGDHDGGWCRPTGHTTSTSRLGCTAVRTTLGAASKPRYKGLHTATHHTPPSSNLNWDRPSRYSSNHFWCWHNADMLSGTYVTAVSTFQQHYPLLRTYNTTPHN